MKHFIYMDTEIVNSYISQLNDGLITKTQTEVGDQTSTSSTETNTDSTITSQYKLSIPAIFTAGIDKKDDFISTATALTQSQSGKELIDKLLHDNAFNLFIKYLEKEDKLKNNICSIGEYVSIKNTFEFWDLDYLIKLFNDEFINYFVASEIEGFKNKFFVEKGKVPNNSDLKNYEKQRKEYFEEIKIIIKLCKDIMPFTKFMMINSCFVPLKDDFLREQINSIRFKYTGEITLIGRYTNDYKQIVEQNEGAAFKQAFSSFDGMVNSFLKEALNIPDYSKVITPIALYFE